MKWSYTRANALRGALIYASGDTVAALMLGDFLWTRLLGIALVGATYYALEIPNYFRWIDRKTGGGEGFKTAIQKTGLAILYFNPLWIARHLLFIRIVSLDWGGISWDLLRIGLFSFLANIPLSLLGNYIIQNVVRLPWRFTASAIFSALMAIYYAISVAVF